MNVLLTAAGRRSYLVDYFRAALRGRGLVVASNSEADAPAMHAADHAIVLPPSHHREYPEALASLCARLDVALLCSCHDLDVLAVARQRDELRARGVIALVPDAEWARLCLDKHDLGEVLRAAGFATPWSTTSLDDAAESLRRGETRFPVVVKARLGFASLALHRCRSFEDLKRSYDQATDQLRRSIVDEFLVVPDGQRVLIQESVEGAELRTVIVGDFEGRYVTHYLSEVHAMRAGETDRATTIDETRLGSFPAELSALVRSPGIVGVDLILDRGVPRILDLNPRFTGDYPFVHLAGADAPAILVALALGEALDPAWLHAAAGVHGYKDIVPKRSPEATG